MDYEKKFWEIYDSSMEEADALEDIMEELGIDWQTREADDGDEVYLEDWEYEDVVNTYLAKTGGVGTEEDLLNKIVDVLTDEGLNVSTFDEVGMLTKNYGFVVRVGNKSYQFEMLGTWH